MDEQMDLFPESTSEPVRSKSGKKITYKPFRPQVPQLCDDCLEEVHAQGWESAPRMHHVRWRRYEGDDVQQLCTGHAQTRMVTESH